MKESEYQKKLIKRIADLSLHEAIVLKNDPNYRQGVPDLIVLYRDRWAALECKRSLDSPCQPNQKWYVNQMNNMSYAAFICPGNEEEVLNELQQALGITGKGTCSVLSE